jgi:hypothetical protein
MHIQQRHGRLVSGSPVIWPAYNWKWQPRWRNLYRVSVTKAIRFATVLVACFAVVLWYVEAGNFSDSNITGVYIASRSGQTSTLTLLPDHTFRQELDEAGTSVYAQGKWQLFPSDSRGHIAFSNEFLRLAGQQLNPDGTAYGQLENWFGMFSISLASPSGGLKFRKRLIR